MKPKPTSKPHTFKPIENGCLFDRTDCLFEWIMLGVGIFIIFIPLLRYIFLRCIYPCICDSPEDISPYDMVVFCEKSKKPEIEKIQLF